MRAASRNRTLAVVAAACFLSGAAGLTYEVVWARYLALFLGHSGYAVMVVLIAFMGGLAVGNFWLGARADRAKSPLALYGWLEISIAIFALLFPAYYSGCQSLCVRLGRGLPPGASGVFMLKFSFSLLTILLPTVLMGGTLPILARLTTPSVSKTRQRVAAVYFFNSGGAVAGVLLADFWWIPSYGLPAALHVAAALNLVAGMAALMFRPSLQSEGADPKPLEEQNNEERFSAAEKNLAVVCIGLSGFVAMLYELAWNRLLALALGSSTHAFSLMLATFLAGLAAGAWIVSGWKPIRNSLDALGWSEAALAATVLFSLCFCGYLPYGFAQASNLLSRQPGAYSIYVIIQALLCFAVMFLPAAFLGMTVPLASRVATAELARAGRSIGRIFSINTLGAVLGAGVTGVWLLPKLGLARVFGLGIGLNALVGWVILQRTRFGRHPVFLAFPILGVWASCWLASAAFADFWSRSFTLGLWREPGSIRSLAEFRAVREQNHLKFYCDGAGATVSVNSWVENGAEQLNLRINGKPDASTTRDMATQLLLGHLPMLLRPDSRRVLVIGLGSGMTCGAVASHPGVEQLDAVEISPEVVTAARLFEGHNRGALKDPRLRLVLDDARAFLQLSTQTYDLIISEPSNPWMAGVGGVFTREFYESCRAHLQTNGLAVQWIHLYESSDEALEIVMRTFSSVFPAMSVWQSRPFDLILIGSADPPAINFAAMQASLDEPGVRGDLQRIEMSRLPVLLAREIIPAENGRFIVPSEGPVHRDLDPVLEFVAQRAFFLREQAEGWRAFSENDSPRAMTLLGKYLKSHALPAEDYAGLVRCHLAQELPERRLIRSLMHRWQRDLPASSELIDFSAQLADAGPAYEVEALRLAPLRDTFFKRAETNAQLLRQYARLLLLTYRSQRSVFYTPPAQELRAVLERLLQTDAVHAATYQWQMGELAWDLGDDETCARWSQGVFETSPSGPFGLHAGGNPRENSDALFRFLQALQTTGQFDLARTLARRAKEAGWGDPRIEMTWRKLGLAQTAAGL